MSLLDLARAKAQQSSGSEACLLAQQFRELDKETLNEVRELLDAEDVGPKTKYLVLTEEIAGLTVNRATIGRKIKDGCGCQWCRTNNIFQKKVSIK